MFITPSVEVLQVFIDVGFPKLSQHASVAEANMTERCLLPFLFIYLIIFTPVRNQAWKQTPNKAADIYFLIYTRTLTKYNKQGST